jgi:hypothetical protein
MFACRSQCLIELYVSVDGDAPSFGQALAQSSSVPLIVAGMVVVVSMQSKRTGCACETSGYPLSPASFSRIA